MRKTYHRGRERAAAAAAVGAVVGASLLVLRPVRVEVRGNSMAPTLLDGDRALAGRLRTPRTGDLVLVEHPARPGYEMVKRIVAGPGEVASDGRVLRPDEFWVEGDDRLRSTDSRHWGPVPRDLLRARVWLVYRPWARRALLRRGSTGARGSFTA